MGFKQLKEFQINIFGLSNKLHEFEFDIDNKLFETKENSLIEKGSGQCKLTLKKSETMMSLHFTIDAEVELICDRSLDPYQHPISCKEDIIIKFGEDDYELSEDVFVVRQDAPSINVGDFIYEFISLAVPMKKLHPRYADDDDQEDLFYTSESEEPTEDTNEDEVDPRWEALKRLKD